MPTWLTTAASAAMLSVSTQTLANWRSLGSGPAYIKLPNGSIRYEAAELQRWMLSGVEAAA